jgi:hypothetical protein
VNAERLELKMSVQRALVGLGESLKPLIWSNRLALRAATRGLDAVYLARRAFGLGHSPEVAEGSVATGAEGLERFERYMAECSGIGGWFSLDSIAIWDALLVEQRNRGIGGDLLEIGVLKGRSATLLALHGEDGQSGVFVDPAFRKEAIDAIQRCKPTGIVLIEALSQNIHDHPEISQRQGAFRWIHIDGEHSGRAVRNDLELALPLLGAEGIICLDDFFSTAYPQITWAAMSFLEAHKDEVTLVLVGANKGYVCRRAAAPAYLAFIRDSLHRELLRRGRSDCTIWKSTGPDDYNCFGITPRHKGFDYHGPDWAPNRIDI